MDLTFSSQKKQGMFSSPKQGVEEPPLPQPDMGALERRVRTLEESLANIRKVLQVTEENILIKNRHATQEFKAISSDLNELRREIAELKDKFLLAIKEMQSLARQEDVRVLERYINLWNPIRFVSREEVEDIVREINADKQQRKQEIVKD